uniref:Spike glycoprotein n=1 Tax=Bat Coronavirus RsYN20 TaxID=3018909 RepID=A0AA49I9B7_9NIDO|nr:spike glycoprotein [Bat Coronavirus RsYN20]
MGFILYLSVLAVVLHNTHGQDPGPNEDWNCGGQPGRLPNLDLGLPPNSTSFVSGYLPKWRGWYCPTQEQNQQVKYSNVKGVFWSYYSSGGTVEVALTGSRFGADKWAMYVFQSNNWGKLHLRICKWSRVVNLNWRPGTIDSSRTSCLLNKQFSFTFPHQENAVLGATWTSRFITFYGLRGVYRFYVPNDWSVVHTKCNLKHSCAFYISREVLTLNVTTNAQGLIQDYNVCWDCRGFPAHVFQVLEGGKIPPGFNFTNWFFLTNTSTIINGRVVTVQPLHLLCLWPVPVLSATDEPVFFNISGAKCNGYSEAGVADALRFSLNFTSEQVFNGVHNIVFQASDVTYSFSCSNDTVGGRSAVPFGVERGVYYCFIYASIGNHSSRSFVGILPPVLREIVVSRTGIVYLNGVKAFALKPLNSVIFNATSTVGSDFWTVAFAKYTQVMMDLNGTSIQDILYCDTPLNRLKCQQLSFSLDDGFYPTTSIYANEVTRSYVALPYHATHLTVNITADLSHPTNHTLLINGAAETFCINTTQFTTHFQQLDSGIVNVILRNGDCPFTLEALNNYLSFDSICFGLRPIGGGCVMNVIKEWLGSEVPWHTLYVSYSKGSKITGVTTPSVGIFDPSFMELGVCTDYTIYGISGRGVINPSNVSYVAGLYFTSISGQLQGFKNATTGEVFVITPCDLSSQAAVISDQIVGVLTASANVSSDFNNSIVTPNFYYQTNGGVNCSEPVLTYGKLGVCPDGSVGQVSVNKANPAPVSPVSTGNISIPSNFTVSVQVEYLQMYMRPVSVDCSMYVCNGNPHCLRLLTQYASACRTIEDALQLSARLESVEVNSAITVSDAAVELANVTNFEHYNMSVLLPRKEGRSFIEDLLFDKIVTSGLGTVDQDYKQCIKDKGVGDVADIACHQYYNGIMVLPGVVDDGKMALYTASLTGGMLLAGITAGASIPFSLAVQSRLNYVALQTDVLSRNQQLIATSFNNAMSNITAAFTEVNAAIKETSDAINTVAKALGKVQAVVNEQGQALSQLTRQLASNFQAISSSIEDIYNRLDSLAADAQVDRLITGRLGALNAFVTQTLTKYTETRASRQLAIQKINECVKSQSTRFGFCGNGTHLFSVANAAPNGIMLFHTVLLPTSFTTVEAWSGVCVDDVHGLILRDVRTTLFQQGGTYYVTTRDMFEPRRPVAADFVRIANCSVTYVNITAGSLGEIIPDYIDVNKTLEELGRPNFTLPDFNLDQFNNTYLNLSAEIALLNAKSESLYNTTQRLEKLIENINNSYIDLELLNRLESYVKWPWYVWLAIFLALILFSFLMLYCCMATGCCGCCSCLSNSCFDCGGRRLQRYEVEKVHIQ